MGITLVMLQLPVRSPQPLIVPCNAWRQLPALPVRWQHPANVIVVWMPICAFRIAFGKADNLGAQSLFPVNHRSAVQRDAVGASGLPRLSTWLPVYCGLSFVPSKACSASNDVLAVRPRNRTKVANHREVLFGVVCGTSRTQQPGLPENRDYRVDASISKRTRSSALTAVFLWWRRC